MLQHSSKQENMQDVGGRGGQEYGERFEIPAGMGEVWVPRQGEYSVSFWKARNVRVV